MPQAELEPAACTCCGREIWIAIELWIANSEALHCRRCELEPPSAVELAFCAAVGSASYAERASEAREAWERDNVVWFHGFADGRAVWKVERPPTERDVVYGGGGENPRGGWAAVVEALEGHRVMPELG